MQRIAPDKKSLSRIMMHSSKLIKDGVCPYEVWLALGRGLHGPDFDDLLREAIYALTHDHDDLSGDLKIQFKSSFDRATRVNSHLRSDGVIL